MQTIKIVNKNGDGNSTKIYDERTGIELQGVRSISLDIVPDDLLIAKVEFVLPKLELKKVFISEKGYKLLGGKRELEF